MNDNIETFNTWNKIAALYQDKFMDLDIYNETYDYICEAINKHQGRILDVGCGPGNITRYLLTKRPDFQIDGIDIAPNMIRLAAENNPGAHFSVMDSREISGLNKKYDGIVCGFCLPYLSGEECQTFIEDAQQLLTDNGLIYLSFVAGNSSQSGYQTGSSGDRIYFYYHTRDAIAAMLKTNGFEEKRVFEVAYKRSDLKMEMHTILVAERSRNHGS